MILHTTDLRENFWIRKNSLNKPNLSQTDTKELTPAKTHQVIFFFHTFLKYYSLILK